MKKILVTGSRGFIGKNLLEALYRTGDLKVLTFYHDDGLDMLESYLKDADIIFHLAGVNRPERIDEFNEGNIAFTKKITGSLEKIGKNVPVVMSSSIQAAFENPYGISKKGAEKALKEYSQKTGAPVYIYRLPNVFGKWARPNHNSVVATFCYNISHGLDIMISDKKKELNLVYIDDVINSFLGILQLKGNRSGISFCKIEKVYTLSLSQLAGKICGFRDCLCSCRLPDFGDGFTKCLYSTYLSYVEREKLSYKPVLKEDNRGSLFELVKSAHGGQIFVSKSHRGVVRGNHYHNTKAEKFCVIKGSAIIKLRCLFDREDISFCVSDRQIEVIDIPPGYTHSIENIGEDEMIAIFWANEIFDSQRPDTYYRKV